MMTALSNLQKQADSRDCVMDDLPINPAALSLELDALGKTCTELDTEAQVCKKVDYEALKQNYIDLKVEVDTKQISYEEITVALEFKVSQAGKLSRQTYQQNHWQQAKITTNLRPGGFAEPHAKYMASFMYSVLGDDDNAGQPFEYPKGVMVDPADGEFCDYLVTVFTPTGDMEESAYFTSIQMSSIDEKVVRTLAAMRENPRWVGCVGMIDTPVQKDAFKTFSDAISEMDGARTFLVAFLANQMRCGVAGTALPFVPCPLLRLVRPSRVVTLHRCRGFLEGRDYIRRARLVHRVPRWEGIPAETLCYNSPGEECHGLHTSWLLLVRHVSLFNACMPA